MSVSARVSSFRFPVCLLLLHCFCCLPAKFPPHPGSVNLDPSLLIQLGVLTSPGGLSCLSRFRVGIRLLLHSLGLVGRVSKPSSQLEWPVLSS